MKKILSICLAVFCCFSAQIAAQIPTNILVQISRAEDELRFDKTLEDLMKSKDPKIRARAALASGRIGKEAAIPALINLLEKDADAKVRSMAAFALGEIESIKGANRILTILQNTKNDDELRARSVEAAGKIAAANAKDAKAKELGKAILDTLQFENNRGARANRDVVLLGITAVLRAKPEGGEAIAAKFLTNNDGRIRADAANTLSRLRAKNANEQLRAMLLSDKDAVARANAARALGVAEDKDAFDILLTSALTDTDSRVRVSAIRSLGSLKDSKAADKLLTRAEILLTDYKKSEFANPVEKSELLEIAAALGRILPNSNNEKAVKFLNDLYRLDKYHSLEIAIGLAKVSPIGFANSIQFIGDAVISDWQVLSSMVQGFAEFANLDEIKGKNKQIKQESVNSLRRVLDEELKRRTINSPSKIVNAIPEVLRAYAAFKPNDLPQVLREYLKHKDV
ncbi:MAG TPA: HEAT repeat domain-containing protein, partial [Pyrinomonadaceae bacterium]|nr:HEAT repeat domain-containing protein [Pyrinomonadaceae bacterium]